MIQKENLNLQEDLREKKHSEDELAVMKAAMEELDSARKDELDGVLIPSSQVKVDKLLGKGGFGVVNLASYNGQLVTMKQLLTINAESVLRFRFECFLMEEFAAPEHCEISRRLLGLRHARVLLGVRRERLPRGLDLEGEGQESQRHFVEEALADDRHRVRAGRAVSAPRAVLGRGGGGGGFQRRNEDRPRRVSPVHHSPRPQATKTRTAWTPGVWSASGSTRRR